MAATRRRDLGSGSRSRSGARPCRSGLPTATGPLLSAGFDAGRSRGQKTPPTEPRLRPRIGRDPGGPWPRHGYRISGLAPAAGLAHAFVGAVFRPRQGLCCPQASMQAAVGVRRPLPQNPGSDRESGAIPVGAALAATGPLLSAGFDAGCSRGQSTPSEPRLISAPASALCKCLFKPHQRVADDGARRGEVEAHVAAAAGAEGLARVQAEAGADEEVAQRVVVETEAAAV